MKNKKKRKRKKSTGGNQWESKRYVVPEPIPKTFSESGSRGSRAWVGYETRTVLGVGGGLYENVFKTTGEKKKSIFLAGKE